MKNLTKIIAVTLFAISSVMPMSAQKYSLKQLIKNHPVVSARMIQPPTINLAYRGLESLEGLNEIPNAETITKVDLSANALQELPAGIFDRFTNLEVLELNDNKIHSIEPGVFDKLQNLRSLYLINNKLPETEQEFRGKHLKNNKQLEKFVYKSKQQEQAERLQRELLNYVRLQQALQRQKAPVSPEHSKVIRHEIETIIKKIMEHPARNQMVPQHDAHGNTALHLAVLANDKDLVELLTQIPGMATGQNKDGTP